MAAGFCLFSSLFSPIPPLPQFPFIPLAFHLSLHLLLILILPLPHPLPCLFLFPLFFLGALYPRQSKGPKIFFLGVRAGELGSALPHRQSGRQWAKPWRWVVSFPFDFLSELCWLVRRLHKMLVRSSRPSHWACTFLLARTWLLAAG